MRDHQIRMPSPVQQPDYRQLYRALAEAAPDAIIAVDEAGVVRMLNTAGERLFGYRAEELIGQSVAVLIPAPLREPLRQRVAIRLASGDSASARGIPITIRTKDNREVPTEVSFGERYVDGHRLYSAIVHDISDRVAVEAALAEIVSLLDVQSNRLEQQIETTRRLTEDLEDSNEELLRMNADLASAATAVREGSRQLRGVMDLLGDAVSVFDDDWRWTYRNPAAARALRAQGRDPEAVIGRVLWEELPELVGTPLETAMRRAVETGTVVSYDEYISALGYRIATRIVPGQGSVAWFTERVPDADRSAADWSGTDNSFRIESAER